MTAKCRVVNSICSLDSLMGVSFPDSIVLSAPFREVSAIDL
jgi:hypothetical protein